MPLEPIDHLNAAAPISSLEGEVVDVDSFYVRSNFEIPSVDSSSWGLHVHGSVASPFHLDFESLSSMPTRTERIVLECAGNFRNLMEPVPSGTPWGIGAASVADFTGVRLRDVLLQARPHVGTVEWVFTGADSGDVEPDGRISYAFPLEVDVAHGEGPLIAWEMNGAPLSPDHGGPVRLVVPGHYGMRSVKWLVSAEAVGAPFTGHFRRKYRYYGSSIEEEAAPVDRIRVRSMIVSPAAGEVLAGSLDITGVAWSGNGPIEAVDVRVDGGPWLPASVVPGSGVHAMSRWVVGLDLAVGEHRIASRATDAAGNFQPVTPPWNRNGYGNNVVHEVAVVATGGT